MRNERQYIIASILLMFGLWLWFDEYRSICQVIGVIFICKHVCCLNRQNVEALLHCSGKKLCCGKAFLYELETLRNKKAWATNCLFANFLDTRANIILMLFKIHSIQLFTGAKNCCCTSNLKHRKSIKVISQTHNHKSVIFKSVFHYSQLAQHPVWSTTWI